MKTLRSTDFNGAEQNVPDITQWGDGDLFKLLSKASSEREGWMKSTKAMEFDGGCVIQVTTQQRNPDGTYSIAEAVTFVPKAEIRSEAGADGNIIGRRLVGPGQGTRWGR